MHTLSSVESSVPNPGGIQLPVGDIDAAFIKRFREQVHALGAVWIFLGCLGVGVLLLPSGIQASIFAEPVPLYLALCVGMGVARIALGTYCLEKQPWALKAGLVSSYVTLALDIVGWVTSLARNPNGTMSILGLIFSVYILLQCRRVNGWAKQMQQAGIPLTLRPSR